ESFSAAGCWPMPTISRKVVDAVVIAILLFDFFHFIHHADAESNRQVHSNLNNPPIWWHQPMMQDSEPISADRVIQRNATTCPHAGRQGAISWLKVSNARIKKPRNRNRAKRLWCQRDSS